MMDSTNYRESVRGIVTLLSTCICYFMLYTFLPSGNCHSVSRHQEPVTTAMADDMISRSDQDHSYTSTERVQSTRASQEATIGDDVRQREARRTLAQVLHYEGLQDPVRSKTTWSRLPLYVREMYRNNLRLPGHGQHEDHSTATNQDRGTVWFVQFTEASWEEDQMQLKFMLQVDTFRASISRCELVVPPKHRHQRLLHVHSRSDRNNVIHMHQQRGVIEMCSDDRNCVSEGFPSHERIHLHGNLFDVYNVTMMFQQWQLPYRNINSTDPMALHVSFPWRQSVRNGRGPMLVIYANPIHTPVPFTIPTEAFQRMPSDIPGMNRFDEQQRARRSSDREYSQCQLREFYVDFSFIGWDSWIVEPKGYEAGRCAGSCEFPLGSPDLSEMSSHALIKHIYYSEVKYGGREDPLSHTPQVHCVPIRLDPISILLENGDSLIYRPLEDMTVGACGCY